jgi:hypothetical protein
MENKSTNVNEITDVKTGVNTVLADRFQIRVSEIKQLKNRLREIDDNEIRNVDFLDDNGLQIQVDEKNLDDWKFTGLNITDFIDSDFYITGFTESEERI